MKETIIKTSDVFINGLKRLGISPDAFAMSIDKDRSLIYRYLNKEVDIPLNVITTLLDLLYEHGVDVLSVLGIDNEDDYFYHATSKEMVFPINVHLNDGRNNDFGYGFYLGENLKQSSTWGKLGYSTIIYRFKRSDFEKLSILDFNERKPIDWLNYIAINRHKINYSDYPKLFEKYKKIEQGKDLIKGKIADSFSYEVLELLYKNKIDIDQAEYATEIMALGNQYCLKNDQFAKELIPSEMIKYDKTLSEYFLHFASVIQDRQNKNIEQILNKPPKKERLFKEYLKKYDE